jgi:hypothetical protein
VRLNRAAVDHRRFWHAMDRLGEGQLREIETRLSRRIVTEFGLDPTGLALGMTKLRHFIDAQAKLGPTRSQLADTLGGGGLSI